MRCVAKAEKNVSQILNLRRMLPVGNVESASNAAWTAHQERRALMLIPASSQELAPHASWHARMCHMLH